MVAAGAVDAAAAAAGILPKPKGEKSCRIDRIRNHKVVRATRSQAELVPRRYSI